MPIKKHLVEVYRNYNIHALSGITPTMFVAEKDDPTKGTTLVNENITALKMGVDNILDLASRLRINVWEGPEKYDIVQKSDVFAKSAGGNFVDVIIIVTPDYDFDDLNKKFDNKAIRNSKKHCKTRARLTNAAIWRILHRSKTIQG